GLDLVVAHPDRELAHDLDGRPGPAAPEVEGDLAGDAVDGEPALSLAADLLALHRRRGQLDRPGQLQGGRRVPLRLQAAQTDGVVAAALVAGQPGQVGLAADALPRVAGPLPRPGPRRRPADGLIGAVEEGQLLLDPVADIGRAVVADLPGP